VDGSVCARAFKPKPLASSVPLDVESLPQYQPDYVAAKLMLMDKRDPHVSDGRPDEPSVVRSWRDLTKKSGETLRLELKEAVNGTMESLITFNLTSALPRK
jgi:hypothetical protein